MRDVWQRFLRRHGRCVLRSSRQQALSHHTISHIVQYGGGRGREETGSVQSDGADYSTVNEMRLCIAASWTSMKHGLLLRE